MIKPSFVALIEKLKSAPGKKPLKEIPKPQPQASKLGKLEPLASIGKPAFAKSNNTQNNDFWAKNTSNNANPGKAMGSDDLYAEDFEDDFHDEDLNKLDTEALKQKKAKMDVLFNKNQKKPGDSGFKYDVQEDFNPKYANEWDLDDDEDIV